MLTRNSTAILICCGSIRQGSNAVVSNLPKNPNLKACIIKINSMLLADIIQVKTFLIPSKSMRVKVKRSIISALFVQIANFIMMSNGLEILNRHSLLLK